MRVLEKYSGEARKYECWRNKMESVRGIQLKFHSV